MVLPQFYGIFTNCSRQLSFLPLVWNVGVEMVYVCVLRRGVSSVKHNIKINVISMESVTSAAVIFSSRKRKKLVAIVATFPAALFFR